MKTININIDINSLSITEKIKLYKFLYELLNAKEITYENSN